MSRSRAYQFAPASSTDVARSDGVEVVAAIWRTSTVLEFGVLCDCKVKPAEHEPYDQHRVKAGDLRLPVISGPVDGRGNRLMLHFNIPPVCRTGDWRKYKGLHARRNILGAYCIPPRLCWRFVSTSGRTLSVLTVGEPLPAV